MLSFREMSIQNDVTQLNRFLLSVSIVWLKNIVIYRPLDLKGKTVCFQLRSS